MRINTTHYTGTLNPDCHAILDTVLEMLVEGLRSTHVQPAVVPETIYVYCTPSVAEAPSTSEYDFTLDSRILAARIHYGVWSYFLLFWSDGRSQGTLEQGEQVRDESLDELEWMYSQYATLVLSRHRGHWQIF